jgi:hypothetical protein
MDEPAIGNKELPEFAPVAGDMLPEVGDGLRT